MGKRQHGSVVALDAASSSSEPRWNCVARAGEFRGHHQGAFKLGAKEFAAMVRNFREHPLYTGSSDVVPLDFDHASERLSDGVSGAPAVGWVLDLEVRSGAAGAELWALTRLLEPALSYVRAGRYRSTSIAFVLDGVHPVSGKAIGPMLTSVALTNQPFIRDLPAIAASASGAEEDDTMDLHDPDQQLQYTTQLIADGQRRGLSFDRAHEAAVMHVRAQLAASPRTVGELGVDPEAVQLSEGRAASGQFQGPAPWQYSAGRNEVERAMHWLAAQPGGSGQPYGELHERACELVAERGGD